MRLNWCYSKMIKSDRLHWQRREKRREQRKRNCMRKDLGRKQRRNRQQLGMQESHRLHVRKYLKKKQKES